MKRLSVSLLISLAIVSVATHGSLTGSGCTSCGQSSMGMTLYPGNSGIGNSLSSYGGMGVGNSLSSAGGFDISSTLSSVGLGTGSNMGNSLSSGGYGNSLSSGYGNSLSSGYGNSLSSGYGNSLSSGYGSSLSSGYNSMSSGYGNSMSSGGMNSMNYNLNNIGGLTTNLGSLGIGSGVGLNTTGLNLGSMNPIGGDASFILNTPSLTGTTFTNQYLNNVDSNPGTITAVTTIQGTGSTATLPPIPPVVVNPTPTVSQPAVTAIKVKDENGNIIQINGYDSSRTTQAVVFNNPIENFNLYRRVSTDNIETIVRDTLGQGDSMGEG